MGIDFSRNKVGDVVRVQCCDDCMRKHGITPKNPPDSGEHSWLCDLCGHYGIGSSVMATICDWLRLKPNAGDKPTA